MNLSLIFSNLFSDLVYFQLKRFNLTHFFLLKSLIRAYSIKLKNISNKVIVTKTKKMSLTYFGSKTPL